MTSMTTLSEKYGDQVINEEGMMELRNTKQRLQQQAEERQEKIKQAQKAGNDKRGIQRKVVIACLSAQRGKDAGYSTFV